MNTNGPQLPCLAGLVGGVVPPLTPSAHKGQAGRIGIMGGSLEYTGAPYYAAMTALRMGADLAHVFCHRDAAVPMKTYSPELIVHPILDAADPLTELEEWLPRLHALVLGPGLGRRPQTFATLGHVLEAAKDRQLLIVLDADALFYLNENYDTIQNYPNALLTPNKVEFARLYRAVMKADMRVEGVTAEHVQQVARRLGVTIACKGAVDIIASGDNLLRCEVAGSPRRCGGQGDVLSGAAAVLLYWAYGTAAATEEPPIYPPTVLAAWGACALTRRAANLAFSQRGRGTLTTDMLPCIPQAFTSLFEYDPNSK
ncbi:ATP-dependent (S)-NAD(P)H-hydrate dehydratase [Chionoecetes opilio]|uniref:ATP-dependent (S)-NAD(P)H-hydrate dehydratase n=1 Tax=Chionoecetes opilio TaxID=41210 RepID=A0A8J4YJ20_CHIOP|nr:ATP-dependent (S)-NAD(P)H-hydrate dehydratase [Chionoecetes opilio]